MCDPQIFDKLCAMYSIGQLVTYSCDLLDESASQSQIVTSKGTYTLVCLPVDYGLRVLNCEHALIRYLKRQGYPTPMMRLTRYGTTAALVNKRLYVLFEALTGRPYDAARPAHLSAAARGLGLFHYLAQAYTGQPPEACLDGLEQPRDEAERLLDGVAAAIKNQFADGQEAYGRVLIESLRAKLQPLRHMLADVDANLLLCTIIHGSYRPAALRYHGETLVSVLDYQHAHWAPRLIDLAQAINSFCSAPQPDGGGALDLERVQSFMESYRDRCSICYEETLLLPLSIRTDCINTALHACATFSQHAQHQRGSLIDILHLLGRVVERLVWLDAHSDTLIQAATSRKTMQ